MNVHSFIIIKNTYYVSTKPFFSRFLAFFVLFFVGFNGGVLAQVSSGDGHIEVFHFEECENKRKFTANFTKPLTPASPDQIDEPYRDYFLGFLEMGISAGKKALLMFFPAASSGIPSYTVTLQATRVKSDDEIEKFGFKI